MKSNKWHIVLFVVLMFFALGCRLVTGLFQKDIDLSKADPPTLPGPPKSAPLIKGTPEEQAVYFADLLSKDETRLSGWLGVYDALGIPVIGQDGAALGKTGDDPIGPRYWQIWYASGLDKKGRGIPLSDAGRLIAAGTPELDGGALGSALLRDLQLASKSNEPQVRLMGMFVRERIKRWPSRLDIQDPGVAPDKPVIDLPTLQMLTWIAMRGALFQVAARSTESAVAIPRPAAFSMVMFQASKPNPASQSPCSEKMGGADSTYWTNWLMNKALGGGVQLPGMTKAFPSLLEKMQNVMEVPTKLIDKTASVITKLNIASALLSFMLLLAAMEIEPRQTPSPMIRTKNTTRGKDGAIELQLYSAPEKIPDGNELAACLGSFAANALGISFSFPAKGPIAGAEMTVEGGKGFPDLVLFNTEGTNSMRRWTGADGVAEYKLFGAPQKKNLPDTAQPKDKEFSVFVKAQPEETGKNSMLNIFFGGLTFGAAPSAAGGLGSAIDIAKGFQYDMGEYVFNITDWKLNGYKATGQTADVAYSGTICNIDEPFTVTGSMMNYKFNFKPSSGTAGSVDISSSMPMITGKGSGTYTIEGIDTDKPRIAVTANTTGTTPIGSQSGGGTFYIDLVPLGEDGCDG